MRTFLGAAAALAIVAAAPAFAQTQTPAKPVTPTPAPAMTAPAAPTFMTTAPTVGASPTAPGTVLQPNAADTPSKPVPGAPLAGANSFTESQAKARIEAKGFSNVSGLKKDDGSIWRGQAMKDGKSVSIALDYQGNVVAN